MIARSLLITTCLLLVLPALIPGAAAASGSARCTVLVGYVSAPGTGATGQAIGQNTAVSYGGSGVGGCSLGRYPYAITVTATPEPRGCYSQWFPAGSGLLSAGSPVDPGTVVPPNHTVWFFCAEFSDGNGFNPTGGFHALGTGGIDYTF